MNMGNVKKSVGKSLAIATLVAGAVALAHALKKNKKAKMLAAAATEAKDHVVAHAKKLGGVSKKSYANIVDSVIDEYSNMKTFTKREAEALAEELKDGWDGVKVAVSKQKKS